MKKHNLTDSTFIIPIRLETDDRLRNIITTICYIISNFDTNIIIHEVDSKSIFLEQAFPQISEFLDGDVKCLEHFFEKSNSSSFHRQKILNDMLMKSKTKVVINYDCDILLPKKSYIDSYNLIVNNHSDVVYPYGDGLWQYQVFADDKLVTDFLVNDFNFELLKEKSKIYMSKYGFVQFFNRDVYIEGGMENENFIAYAPEDVERYHRFVKLGYKVDRINNWVYHLEHKRTPNSLVNNPHMDNNNNEWEKIKKMSSKELNEYIKNQPYYLNRIN